MCGSSVHPPRVPASGRAPSRAHGAVRGACTARVQVGESLPHNAAARQTTGEAEYTDDRPSPPDTLHGWLVRAAQAPATLLGVDKSAALLAPGVVAVLDVRVACSNMHMPYT